MCRWPIPALTWPVIVTWSPPYIEFDETAKMEEDVEPKDEDGVDGRGVSGWDGWVCGFGVVDNSTVTMTTSSAQRLLRDVRQWSVKSRFGCGGFLIDIWVGTWVRGFHWGASDFCFRFKNASPATVPLPQVSVFFVTVQWPLPQVSVFFTTWGNGRRRPGEDIGFTCRLGCQWGYDRVWIVCSPIVFVVFSIVDLISISRYF